MLRRKEADIRTSPVLAVLAAAVLAVPLATRAQVATIRVENEAQFASAVAALRDSGGTIVLLPHAYRGELTVGSRSTRTLRIVGEPGARVRRLVLDHARRVSVGQLTIAPLGADAALEVDASNHVDLHDLVLSAAGTRLSASILVPDSSHVTIRRSELTHCGDRSPAWSNCVQLSQRSRHVTIEDNRFHDCYGCDFVHGRFGADLAIRRNRFERALPCRTGVVRCKHQDLIELFAGRGLVVEQNVFGVYRRGGAQLYLTGPTDDVTVVNNVFLATDPRVPRYRVRVGLIVGSSHATRLPLDVRIVNNTILSGARRTDGYLGSLRMSALYGGVPRGERPLLANNVIGIIEERWPVCSAARLSVSNVILRGRRCSRSDRVGPAHLDARGRPTAASTLLIDRASPRFEPATDLTGRPRGKSRDIGAFEYRGRRAARSSRARGGQRRWSVGHSSRRKQDAGTLRPSGDGD